MRLFRVSLLSSALLLSACGNAVTLTPRDTSLQEALMNPLTAERYYDDLTQQMVSLALNRDPLLEDPAIKETVDRTRMRSLEFAEQAVTQQRRGLIGSFLSDRGWTFGEALLLDDTLYFGPTFETAPGPNLQVYLSTVLDPRFDTAFPDDSAVLVGPIKSAYGAQAFTVPARPTVETGSGAAPARLRTVVLWDEDLHVIYGFVQLNATN